MSDQNNTPPPLDVKFKFQMQVMTKMNARMNSVMRNVCDRLEKVGKQGKVAGTYTQNVRKVGAELKSNNDSGVERTRWVDYVDFEEGVDDNGDGGFKDEIISHREGIRQPRNRRDFMYFDEVLWQRERRIQKERWYQRERNKEIIVLKKESNSLSRILGEMKQELDVLTSSQCAASFRKRGEKNRTAAIFIQSCWRRLLARKELQRLQNEAKELSIQLVGDSRMNHLEERGNDTIQERSNSDFDVQRATIQFLSAVIIFNLIVGSSCNFTRSVLTCCPTVG